MIYGAGMLEMGITMSLAQLVIDNEFIAMIKRVLQGIPVNDETLAVDVIKRVGARGNFLVEEHTVRHMVECNSQAKLIDRTTRETWEARGARDLTAKAEEKAREILETHRVEPLPDNVAKKISSLREQAEEELGLFKK